MKPLQLSFNLESWRPFMRRKADPAFRRIRDKVFYRDQYTCQFCGFQAYDYQEVVNIDQDYHHNSMSNMATACCFCAQSLFVPMVGKGGFGGGKLIYLPEMSQVELNSFCHVIFCAMSNATGYHDTSQMIYRNFKFRAQPIEDKFGSGASNPSMFWQMLSGADVEEQQEVEKITKDFRLLPSYAKFKKQLERWAATAAEELEKSE